METIPEQLKSEDLVRQMMLEQFSANLRVASPGIIESFDPIKQTVRVQLAIREKIIISGQLPRYETIPVLVDVPVFMPRAGGYAITMPIIPGDECLVIFGDRCMDAWWQSGGVQNQIEKRYHDLSDGCALLGIWSQPHRINEYKAGALQIRNEAGTALVEVAGDSVNVLGGSVTIAGGTVEITGGSVAISSDTTIDGKIFLAHTHSDPQGGFTGGVA